MVVVILVVLRVNTVAVGVTVMWMFVVVEWLLLMGKSFCTWAPVCNLLPSRTAVLSRDFKGRLRLLLMLIVVTILLLLVLMLIIVMMTPFTALPTAHPAATLVLMMWLLVVMKCALLNFTVQHARLPDIAFFLAHLRLQSDRSYGQLRNDWK
jgi:hypothetical protein